MSVSSGSPVVMLRIAAKSVRGTPYRRSITRMLHRTGMVQHNIMSRQRQQVAHTDWGSAERSQQLSSS